MDHLPLCDDGLRKLGAVELLCTVPYDDGGFWGFPERQGWSQEEIVLGLTRGSAIMMTMTPRNRQTSGNTYQDPAVYASLIQSWWYIGLLQEILQTPLPIDSLFPVDLSGRRVLKTMGLRTILDNLSSNLQKLPLERARERLTSMKRCLNYVHRSLEDLAGRIDGYRNESAKLGFIREVSPDTDARSFERFYWTQYGRKVLPDKLEMSICALGYTLEYAIRNIYVMVGLGQHGDPECPSMPRWHIPTSLRMRIQQQGFCRLDYQRYKPTLAFLGACMASTFDRRWESHIHSQCTENQCAGDNIERDNYQQRHMAEDCKCSMVLPSDIHDKILGIIRKDSTPVVKVALESGDSTSGLVFEVLDIASGVEYIAFSHVWANGRGNTKGNGLYQCQWLHLQSLAVECRESENADLSTSASRTKGLVPFWLDTVCIPCGPEDQIGPGLRSKAILQMPEIYRKASDVLVLDAQLENFAPVALVDICMRVTLSSWMRRLWTMHEGAVAKSVLIQTAKGPISLGGLANAALDFVNKGKEGLVGGALHRIGLAEAVMMWAKCLNILPSMSYGHEHFLFLFSWTEARRRSTSVPLDRYLVMGILNNLSKPALLELQRAKEDNENLQAAAEKKLMTLLMHTPKLPATIIFSLGKRIPGLGLGWAPASTDSQIDNPQSNEPAAIRVDDGLIVEYQGWNLLSIPDWSQLFLRDHQYVVAVNSAGQARHDVRQTLPANLLFDVPQVLAETQQGAEDARPAFLVSIKNDESSEIGENLYNVNVAGPAGWEAVTAGTGASLCMILQPQSDSSRYRKAILVKNRGQRNTDGAILVKFVVQMWWYPLVRKEDIEAAKDCVDSGLVKVVVATWVNGGSNQSWCVG